MREVVETLIPFTAEHTQYRDAYILEQSQNQLRISWSREEVDARLVAIMTDIHTKCVRYGARHGKPVDYRSGANIADAMLAYGVV